MSKRETLSTKRMLRGKNTKIINPLISRWTKKLVLSWTWVEPPVGSNDLRVVWKPPLSCGPRVTAWSFQIFLFLAVPRQLIRFKCLSVRPYKTKLILGVKGWENLMDHSDRVGPLETFDLNEKLGHLHDLNDTHDLNVTSQWPQRPQWRWWVRKRWLNLMTSTYSMTSMKSRGDLNVSSQWPQRDLTVTSTTSQWPQLTSTNSRGDLNK